MKSLFAGHRSRNKPWLAEVIDLFEASPWRANFLTTVTFSKRVWG